ncbi:MAG: sulfatase-like hydrolase/transferase [Pseudomonadales bacterium]|nr:sulfatase-like hydrolase/transferase [Pseudomonadales bacterium]
MKQPNILFIYSDQHRADVMGCAGNEVVKTPNLDRLAAEGMRFTQAWTESPICQPARASLLTGRYPHQHGIIGNFTGECRPDWQTYTRNLQEAGYKTAVVGKTHYSNWPMGKEREPAPGDEWLQQFGYDHVIEEFDRYVHVNYETPFTRFVKERGDLAAYRKTISDRFRIGDRHWEGVTSPLPQALDLTSFLAGEAERWLDTQTGDNPWFLNLAFVQPHVPLMGDPEWADYYKDKVIRRSNTAIPSPDDEQWADHIALIRKHSHSELLTDEFVMAGARQYYAMVSLIDQKIGEVLAKLETRGELDNTLIIYSSDHGEMLGDHGLMAKMCFYKSSVRVPMIIRPPGGCESGAYDSPVQAFDMVATMLEAAGAKVLEGASARSLLPVLRGENVKVRDVAHSMIRMRPGLPTWVAVTDGNLRLTYELNTGEWVELFDLSDDPDENENLVAQMQKRSEVARLHELSKQALSQIQ